MIPNIPEPAVKDTLRLPTQEVCYRVYRKPRAPQRRLVLLHGGGVAGKLTWEGIIAHLGHWSEILVPDLRGSGDTHHPDRREHGFEVEEAAGDIVALAAHLGYANFDLGGYSYGGLVAMVLKTLLPQAVEKTYLLEPALLGRHSEAEMVQSRDLLLHAAVHLKHPEKVEEGLELFLDAVSPTRSRGSRNEEIVRQRLSHRPAGLACAIECVSRAAKRLDRAWLIAAQAHVSNFVGERSSPEIYRLCREIAATRDDWICHRIQGADHALPFQKPEAIARHMNADLATYLGGQG